jgi:hypothetical protein
MFFPLPYFVFLASAIYSPSTAETVTGKGEIKWHTCDQNGTLSVTCGTLRVPLDYTDLASSKTLELSLVKVNATKQPSKGSILLNPGGPGVSGTSFLKGPIAQELLE